MFAFDSSSGGASGFEFGDCSTHPIIRFVISSPSRTGTPGHAPRTPKAFREGCELICRPTRLAFPGQRKADPAGKGQVLSWKW